MNIKAYKKDIITLSILTVAILLITWLLLNVDLKIGVYYIRDVYGYLNNALFFAGYDSGVSTLRGLAPVIPLITSIFFRLGFIYDGTIIIVSSIFYVLSVIGMYLLLRLRFNELMSFTGAIILATFPINLVWATKGMLDLPGLCISIWAIYFTILSFKKSPKFLYITFPLLIIGFFTRYTVALIIPVVLIQFLLIENPIGYIKSNLKHIIIAVVLGIITLLIFMGIYSYFNLPPFFLSQTATISSSNSANSVAAPVENNLLYYINNMLLYMGAPNFIPYSLEPGAFSIFTMNWHGGHPSIISYALFLIIIVGIAIYIKNLSNSENKISINEKNTKALVLTSLLTLILFLATYTRISIFLSLAILSISLLAMYLVLNKSETEHMNLDFIFIYWFLMNFIFFTYHHTKVDRYAITFTPFLAYMIILSLSLIFDKVKSYKHGEKIKIIVPIALICAILLCTGVYCINNDPHTFDNQVHPNLVNASNEEKMVGNWLINHDKNYSNKTIWADRGGDMSFLLKMHIPSLEHISNSSNFTDTMINENVTYFIAKDNKTIGQPYVKLYQNGEVSIYSNR